MRNVLEWVIAIAAAIVCALLIRAFVAEVYEVPTGSMLETIQLGDRLLGEKITYKFRSPQVGEVVTFMDPQGRDVNLIKRVIATAGQTVDVRDGAVYVDGNRLDEPYTLGKESQAFTKTVYPGGISYPFTVPEGCVWLMGDNRTDSADSRYFGPVNVSDVTSRALFIFWPFSDARGL
jgi:signal peptidase I